MFSRAVINTTTNAATYAAATTSTAITMTTMTTNTTTTTTNTVINVIQLLGILTYSELFYIISLFPKIHPLPLVFK
jgi:hypothetical protein